MRAAEQSCVWLFGAGLLGSVGAGRQRSKASQERSSGSVPWSASFELRPQSLWPTLACSAPSCRSSLSPLLLCSPVRLSALFACCTSTPVVASPVGLGRVPHRAVAGLVNVSPSSAPSKCVVMNVGGAIPCRMGHAEQHAHCGNLRIEKEPSSAITHNTNQPQTVTTPRTRTQTHGGTRGTTRQQPWGARETRGTSEDDMATKGTVAASSRRAHKPSSALRMLVWSFVCCSVVRDACCSLCSRRCGGAVRVCGHCPGAVGTHLWHSVLPQGHHAAALCRSRHKRKQRKKEREKRDRPWSNVQHLFSVHAWCSDVR